MNLYCPHCKRLVGGKRILDGTTLGVSGALSVVAVGILVVLFTISTVGLGSILIYFTLKRTYEKAPLACPFCNVRLFNPGLADEEAAYKSLRDANAAVRDARQNEP